MASAVRSIARPGGKPLSGDLDDIPILYEDEEEGDMGESNPHTDSSEIIHVCVMAHLRDRPQYRVFANMNCYYRNEPRHPKTGSLPYISPDVMVVEPNHELGEDVKSYEIGRDGPAPLQATEVLSQRSAQQRDLGDKLVLYAKLRVAEYILADITGRFLQERLLLKRLQPDGRWKNAKDSDGGLTSLLGFRVVIDEDGRLRVLDAASGRKYVRPDEAEARIRPLEAELNQLRGSAQVPLKQRKPNRRRRKK